MIIESLYDLGVIQRKKRRKKKVKRLIDKEENRRLEVKWETIRDVEKVESRIVGRRWRWRGKDTNKEKKMQVVDVIKLFGEEI